MRRWEKQRWVALTIGNCFSLVSITEETTKNHADEQLKKREKLKENVTITQCEFVFTLCFMKQL